MSKVDNKPRKRSEIPVMDTWDLSQIFHSENDWMKEYEALNKEPETLAGFEGHLGESAELLLRWFKKCDDIRVRMNLLYNYAMCHHDEDTADPHYVDLKGKATQTYVHIDTAMSFADPEILAIPDETLESFYAQEPALKEYKRSIELIRRQRRHTLSKQEEALLSAAANISDAAHNISSMLHNADMTFPDVADSKGVLHPLSQGTFTLNMESDDRQFRINTFRTYYEKFTGLKNTLAACLDEQMKQLRFFSQVRHFDSVLEASLFSHEVPVSVYHGLIEAVHDNLPAMYRYVTLRKKMLGLDELHMYDVYTPLVADCKMEFSFDEAKETVLKALSVLGSDYVSMLNEAFDNRWIDKYENIGKRSGAYSTDVYQPHPYVLLNFNGNLDSVFTLAHELGHAMHSYLSGKNQPVSTADYVIFVAEVASTVNEVLLERYLLDHTDDPKEKACLINHFLEQFKSTLFRQTMFAEFELEMGKLSENGESLTAQLLHDKYLALNQKYFGPDMISDDEIGYEWSRIPHFYYDFYVFQYATGFSAAVAIASRILNEGAPAVADYMKFLSGGCSTDPISLLKIAGVDMSTKKPVANALQLFDSLISDLEKLQPEL